jgi:hypothetical protein
MPRKRKKSVKDSVDWLILRVYGIWSKADNRLVYVSLLKEDMKTEFELERYKENDYLMVCLDATYDIKSLGLSNR